MWMRGQTFPRFLRSREEENKLKIALYKNFEPKTLKIVNRSECLIGNTSSGIRECLSRTSIY